MSVTEIAGFLLKSYKTLQDMARKTTTFQRKINGMSVVQGELIRSEPKWEALLICAALTDAQWAIIAPHCLGRESDPGRAGPDPPSSAAN